MRRNIERGFTLIELMIVVAIVGILAMLAMPVYQDYMAKADVTNALGGLAGEKSKVAQNFSEGVDLCDKVADNDADCNSATGILIGDSESGRSQVQLTPALPPAGSTDKVTWACQVLESIGNRIASDCTDQIQPQ